MDGHWCPQNVSACTSHRSLLILLSAAYCLPWQKFKTFIKNLKHLGIKEIPCSSNLREWFAMGQNWKTQVCLMYRISPLVALLDNELQQIKLKEDSPEEIASSH